MIVALQFPKTKVKKIELKQLLEVSGLAIAWVALSSDTRNMSLEYPRSVICLDDSETNLCKMFDSYEEAKYFLAVDMGESSPSNCH
jgi:hypothetical protein